MATEFLFPTYLGRSKGLRSQGNEEHTQAKFISLILSTFFTKVYKCAGLSR